MRIFCASQACSDFCQDPPPKSSQTASWLHPTCCMHRFLRHAVFRQGCIDLLHCILPNVPQVSGQILIFMWGTSATAAPACFLFLHVIWCLCSVVRHRQHGFTGVHSKVFWAKTVHCLSLSTPSPENFIFCGQLC